MTNLIVSHLCSLNCPFCFAQNTFRSKVATKQDAFVSEDVFTEWLNGLERSGIRQVRLVGGEPTLHPGFTRLVEFARGRGMPLFVFTNGFVSEQALECLENLTSEECTVLVNISAGEKNENILAQQRKALRRLGSKASAGITIASPNLDLGYAILLILETGCRKALRIGLAHPVYGDKNVYLHPKQYKSVAPQIIYWAQRAASHDIRLEFDCGFVRCMFTEEEVAILCQTQASFGWNCSPIPDVDIDGLAYPCFPLAKRFSVPLEAKANFSEARERFIQQTQPYRLAGIYPSCSSCDYKLKSECSGGCLAFTLRRFRPLRHSVLSNLQNLLCEGEQT